MKEGEVFESDTDTEVIPKLCKFLYRWAAVGSRRGRDPHSRRCCCSAIQPSPPPCWIPWPTRPSPLPSALPRSRLPEPIPFPQLVCEVVKQLEGAYALLIKSSVYPGELVACRRGSPLILGMKYGIQVGGRAREGQEGEGTGQLSAAPACPP